MTKTTTLSDQSLKKFWTNKRVLLTGGTAGLGKALALYLSELQALVTVVARGQEKLEAINNPKAGIYTIQADISEKEDIYLISSLATGKMGGIDVLINNASYLGPTPLQSLLDTECEDLELVLQTNVVGPFRLTKVVLSSMLLGNGGMIINISSDAARHAYPNWGSYSISKIALDHLSQIWQAELLQSNIKFLSIDPGDMNTSMHFDAIPDADPSQLYQPRDVAKDLVLFLAQQDFEKVRYSSDEWRELL